MQPSTIRFFVGITLSMNASVFVLSLYVCIEDDGNLRFSTVIRYMIQAQMLTVFAEVKIKNKAFMTLTNNMTTIQRNASQPAAIDRWWKTAVLYRRRNNAAINYGPYLAVSLRPRLMMPISWAAETGIVVTTGRHWPSARYVNPSIGRDQTRLYWSTSSEVRRRTLSHQHIHTRVRVSAVQELISVSFHLHV